MNPLSVELAAGKLVAGKYRVERVLGKGGMGVVLEVTHVRLNTRFALKLLRADLADEPTIRERFEREAVAIARLRTPHVVKVFDVDVTAEGEPFIVMELLAGHDLSRVMQDPEPMPTEAAVDVMLQVCSAMHQAHAVGVIHRDLKPTNIFVMDVDGLIKVLDFGVSKIRGTAELTTTDSGLVGTPQYIAPERLRGASGDHRVDIWSMGVILYRMLAKRYPFAVEQGAPSVAVAVAAVSEDAIRLSVPRPDLPPAFVAAVMGALERDPDRRYSSAAAMAEALRPFGSGRVAFDDDVPSDPVVATSSLLSSARLRTSDRPTDLDPVAPRKTPEAEIETVHGSATEVRASIASTKSGWRRPTAVFLGVLLLGGAVLLGSSIVRRSPDGTAESAPAAASLAPAPAVSAEPAAVAVASPSASASASASAAPLTSVGQAAEIGSRLPPRRPARRPTAAPAAATAGAPLHL